MNNLRSSSTPTAAAATALIILFNINTTITILVNITQVIGILVFTFNLEFSKLKRKTLVKAITYENLQGFANVTALQHSFIQQNSKKENNHYKSDARNQFRYLRECLSGSCINNWRTVQLFD